MWYYKYIRIILILIPIIILGGLFYLDFNPSGYLKVNYDFCQSSPFISKFSPHGRVLDIQHNGGECLQPMVIDPVYFDVRLPQKFNRAHLKIWYQKDKTTPLKIGPVMDLKNWQWQLKDAVYLHSAGEWQLASADYDLTHLKMDGPSLRWLISSPNLDVNQQEIIFNKISLEFFKEPLKLNNLWPRLKDWLFFVVK